MLTREVSQIVAALDDQSVGVRHAALRVIGLVLPLISDDHLQNRLREIAESSDEEARGLAAIALRNVRIASDSTRRGDVRQTAWLLGRESSIDAGEPPFTPDLTKKAADAFDEYLKTGHDRELFRYLKYLESERATLLITEMFKRSLRKREWDEPSEGCMAGNPIVVAVAAIGRNFVPDIPALFALYLDAFRHASGVRADWYRTADG
jgi:hypothetical protein